MNTTVKFSDASMVARIAELEPGWATAADIAWSLSDGSYEGRSRVKTILGELLRAGLIERMYVRHRDEPMVCYNIIPDALNGALEEWAE